MKRLSLFALSFAAAFAVACQPDPAPYEPDIKPDPTPVPTPQVDRHPGEYILPLIQTTDLHGYMVYSDGDNIHYRLAYIADKVKDVRGRGAEYDKSRLLLLDGGDIYQGASISNLQAGRPVYTSFGRMDYDAVAVGNHEFDWGFDTLVDADATMLDYEWNGYHYTNEVPVVCTNLYRNGSRDPHTRDYVIVRKTASMSNGDTVAVRIGVIGFAPNYSGSIMQSKFAGAGYEIRENYTIANNLAAQLEADGQCDATILLHHGSCEDAAESLGQSTVIDFVLGGHTHRALLGRTSWGLRYMQGGRHGENYAFANLRFAVDSTGTISFLGADDMRTMNVPSGLDVHTRPGQNADDLDDEVLAISEAAVKESEEQLKDIVGYITVGATNSYLSGSGERATTMGNWMCDVTRRIGEADVAFVNGGGVRTTFPLNGQSRRDITVSNIYEAFPFSNLIYVYKLTYAELLKVFEYALTSGGKSLFTYMTGIDCYYDSSVRRLQKDNTVLYDNGKWYDDWASREVILAVSEYLATTERTDYYTGTPNPLVDWNSSSRLLYNNLVDNENAVLVLKDESAKSGGKLKVDTAAHFINY